MVVAASPHALIGISILVMAFGAPVWGLAMRDGGKWTFAAFLIVFVVAGLWVWGVIELGHS